MPDWRAALPRSLLARMLVLTLLVVVLAQGLSSLIWLPRLRASQTEVLLADSRNLAQALATSAGYFRSLPRGYRPLVLDQLHDMGGARFFVSLNDRYLAMRTLPAAAPRRQVLREVEQVLRARLGREVELALDFVVRGDLRVFNGGLKLEQLPRAWAHYGLSPEAGGAPVLVAQIRIAPDEWLYLAAPLPIAEDVLRAGLLPRNWLSVLLTSGLLLLCIGLLVHWQSKPLKRLAAAARALSMGAEVRALPEAGGSEVVEVSRAFNSMRERIGRYLNERSQLFSAISHDLRTPITRLRLRVELLDDEQLQARFGRDLDELELLVKGALQCVRDTDIHENIEQVDLDHLLHGLVEPYLGSGRVTLAGRALERYPGKPLALRRCIGNLLDNALKYGERAHLWIEDCAEAFILHVDDEGPGVPEQSQEQVFEPRFRLAGQQQGYGLGLGIARSLAHSHGGELRLRNLREGGLRVTLWLPRQASM